MVDPLSTRDLIKRLGTFLADLTSDRAAARIHADIAERLRETWQEPDPQLSGIYLDDKDFSSVWTAIRNGASLPINSWDTVVLPVIVYYSRKESLKPNLQTAIHLWGQARSSLSNVLEGPSEPIVPVYEVMAEQTLDTLALPPSVPIPPERATTPRARRSGRRWLVAAVASVLVALAAVAVVLYDNATKEPYAGTLPRNVTTGYPTSSPDTSPSPSLEPSESPTPEPSMPPVQATSMAPGVVAPSSPRSLASIGKTHNTAKLGWQPPASAGTGGLSHYRIFKGAAEIGTAMSASFTVTGLTPKTTYVFSVLAVNHAGASSQPSNAVSVTTDAPSAPPGPQPTVATSPASPISYGLGFSVVGENWPCTAPAQVEVYLDGAWIAVVNTDTKGHFEAQIDVIDDLPNSKVAIVDPQRPGEYLILKPNMPTPLKAILRSHSQCSSTAVATGSVTFFQMAMQQ
ncbi:hypothetical protein Rhe02_94700 [Rhizocola hellebori]|uniref:Fibronectin type-III domain-containing protein n=1 Tax=Rhizocola hellebori TaxID=1392758 RepID=A0A8J3QIA7_9ACTN|nr:fibronectin type III domain-containing protein [Rhizocola hellebori]GIH11403.1 hypothetical protein Rhe02_94700 [Rhizocola hellebori]